MHKRGRALLRTPPRDMAGSGGAFMRGFPRQAGLDAHFPHSAPVKREGVRFARRPDDGTHDRPALHDGMTQPLVGFAPAISFRGLSQAIAQIAGTTSLQWPWPGGALNTGLLMYGDGDVLYWAELHLCQPDTVDTGVGPHRYRLVANASRDSVDLLSCQDPAASGAWRVHAAPIDLIHWRDAL